MSTKPRTIDNLGVDISIEYAKNRELIDTKLLEESKRLPFQTEVTVTTPYVPSEWDEIFSTRKKHEPWAKFFAPPEYTSHRKSLFTFQLIPSMGPPERHDAEIEKLLGFKEKKKKRKKGGEEEEKEKEKETILTFLKKLAFLDKQLLFINARRSQYHKG